MSCLQISLAKKQNTVVCFHVHKNEPCDKHLFYDAFVAQQRLCSGKMPITHKQKPRRVEALNVQKWVQNQMHQICN